MISILDKVILFGSASLIANFAMLPAESANERCDNNTYPQSYIERLERENATLRAESTPIKARLSIEVSNSMDDLQPDVREATVATLREARAKGLDVMVFETGRSLMRQYHLKQNGTTPTMRSKHLIGEAVDIVFVVDGQPSWDPYHNWDLLGEIGKSHGFDWGGEFKTVDRPHFQMGDWYTNSIFLDLSHLK